MRIINNPPRETWPDIVKRPALDTRFLERTVANIIDDVRRNGDTALRHCALHFDKVSLDRFEVTADEFAAADEVVAPKLKSAIATAKSNIEKFHVPAAAERQIIETTPGVFCWRKSIAIEKVGLYVPAGSAPLFSTVLMLAIPARLAGCSEIALCSPPAFDGTVNAATLYAARLCGVTRVFKIGGVQAIAAMAFGTESVPNVYKIFGPGNQFVTEAKRQVTKFGVAIDMPAGPSEVAVLADATANASFVAADLLAQAEHGPDSQVMLVTTSSAIIDSVRAEIDRQIEMLPRRATAEAALKNSSAILIDQLATGIALVNAYAPEHLIIATEDATRQAELVVNAGSVFVGKYSCESAGDYASGTNHTLPTGGFARSSGGVSVESFTRAITFQQITSGGLQNLGPTIEILAAAESLLAHERAVSIRLAEIDENDV